MSFVVSVHCSSYYNKMCFRLQVTIFSDPMVGALTSLVDPTHKNATDTSNDRGQYIPIPGTIFFL